MQPFLPLEVLSQPCASKLKLIQDVSTFTGTKRVQATKAFAIPVKEEPNALAEYKI